MKGKKWISLLLLISMFCSVLPVHAEEEHGPEQKDAFNTIDEAKVKWRLNKINTDILAPQEVNSMITVSADVTGDTQGLKYKFVWMKNNWDEWGVIQESSEKNSAEWKPEKAGQYWIYADVEDGEGNSDSISCQYSIQWPQWTYDKLQLPEGITQKKGTPITISAQVSGNTEGLQYKFVWMKDDWKKWAVIEDYSEESSITFTPDEVGKYFIYCDIRGIDGNIVSKSASFESASSIWEYKGLAANPQNSQPLNTDGIQLAANVSGETDSLLYKYVWEKDNWSDWDVIQDFSAKREVVWIPKEIGNYTLYCDIKDQDGRVITKTISYKITNIEWKNEGIQIIPEKVQKLGEAINIKLNVSGNTKGMQYKFVWMQNDWETWKVIQDFSDKAEATFVPEKTGDYNIYVDIREWDGTITTISAEYKVMTDVWELGDIVPSLPSPQEKYTVPIKIKAETTGENDRLQYKFVWAKAGWDEWGVIGDYSALSEIEWYPKETGLYSIYVDVKDVDGNVITKSIPYVISKVNWSFDKVSTLPEDVQKKGEKATIKAETSGNVTGLRYKFVWMKDNWKEWGVIQDYSEKSEAEWNMPESCGPYKIYVDVKDRDGEVRTQIKDYFSASQIWQHEGLEINHGEQEQIYTELPIEAKVSGETENLQYKYVWMRNDWEEWGVIRDYNEEQDAVWFPKKPGIYKIYSDVKDVDGRVQTEIKQYEVLDAPWKLEELKVNGSGSYFVGNQTTVTAMVSGETDGLQFKFVQRNGSDWSDWKVIQEFSPQNSVQVTLEKSGYSNIYVDIMDQRGVTFDPEIITLRGHEYNSAGASSKRVSKGKNVQLYPNISGTAKGLECKYVWMKNNWGSWGVISDFTSATSMNWTPKEAGRYYIYIDARLNGVVQSRSVMIDVVDTKNGWYYENGYKFYYAEDRKVEDVRNIIGNQSSYLIKVNKQMSCVTVYAKDGNNGYIIPVVAFACSPGAGTPIGTFYTQNKYRWHHLYGADGQFCTRITGHILFHSPPYSSFNNHTLWPKDYNKLGTWASAGCVRLRSGDAKWIYDNCGLGTQVVIYNSGVAGPFTKPVYSKIPLWQTWDPTDPYA